MLGIRWVEVDDGIVEREGDSRGAERLAACGSREDHVHHRAAPQALGGTLAEHPLDRIHHVGFAAAVGPDDAGNGRVEPQLHRIGEGLESRKRDLRQTRAVVIGLVGC